MVSGLRLLVLLCNKHKGRPPVGNSSGISANLQAYGLFEFRLHVWSPFVLPKVNKEVSTPSTVPLFAMGKAIRSVFPFTRMGRPVVTRALKRHFATRAAAVIRSQTSPRRKEAMASGASSFLAGVCLFNPLCGTSRSLEGTFAKTSQTVGVSFSGAISWAHLVLKAQGGTKSTSKASGCRGSPVLLSVHLRLQAESDGHVKAGNFLASGGN